MPAVPVPATCASDVMSNLKSNGLPWFIAKREQHGATCMCVCVCVGGCVCVCVFLRGENNLSDLV